MKVLVVPMFALSAMGGPWSRAQKVAAAFQTAGHEVAMGMACDGNCRNPVAERILDLPAPAPLGAPMAIAKRTFPIATKLGIAGRKPVRSFEEVLWLTGNLSHAYLEHNVQIIREFIRNAGVDAVYSEFSLPAIIAARAEGVPLVGSASFPTQASYATMPAKSGGLRRFLGELGLPGVESALELFGWMDRRFIPSCPELEPVEGKGIVFCGLLEKAPATASASRSLLVLYLGSGTVPKRQLVYAAVALASRAEQDVYLAGVDPASLSATDGTIENLHCAPRLDFETLLPRAAAFVNHGGQNSVMDALRFGAPQAIYPGKVFERQYNAESIQAAGAGIRLGEFTAEAIERALQQLATDDSYRTNAAKLQEKLSSLGGAERIVAETERLV